MTSRRWNYSVTTMNAETDGNSTSAYEPGAGNVSAVADDDAAISPNTDETTSIASEPAGCPVPCKGQDQYGNGWTGCPGSYVTRPCPNRALGEAKWFCDSYGNSFVGSVPDYGNCTHMWIEEAEEEISEGRDAVQIASFMQKWANRTSFFGHELSDVMRILGSTFRLHMRQVLWEYPAIRLNKSAIFTSSATGVMGRLLVSKLGLEQLVESQRVSLGSVLNSLATSVGFTLASLAADLGENFKYNATFLPSNNTALLFGVGVFDTNRTANRLVFPPEDGFTKSRITVDADGLKRPRSVGVVLSSEPAALLFPPSRNNFVDETAEAKILNSVLISYSIQDASETRMERFRAGDGAVQILLQHVKVAKGPQEVTIRRRLHEGEEPAAVLGSARESGLWDESGCRVDFSDETYTRCVCSHLSTFAVLMDVHDYVEYPKLMIRLIRLPPPVERDCVSLYRVGKDAALEVLSFTCSGASVLCLLVTLAVFQGCRSIQGERTDIGKNVCACLLGGHVTTLFFLDKTYINFSETFLLRAKAKVMESEAGRISTRLCYKHIQLKQRQAISRRRSCPSLITESRRSVVFDRGWVAALPVPGRLLLDDSGGSPPVPNGRDGVRQRSRFPTMVPGGGVRSPGVRRDPDDGRRGPQGRQGLRERRTVHVGSRLQSTSGLSLAQCCCFPWFANSKSAVMATTVISLETKTINTAVLVLALREAVSAGLSQGKSKTETVWIWIRGWFSLSALLGITWLFGLAYMEFNHSFVYVFVVLNGCQGLFIFLFRCVLSHQVRVSVTTRVKRDGFLELLRGLAMRCSPRPSDSTRTTATEHTDWVHDDRSNRPLWFVLTQGDKAAFNWGYTFKNNCLWLTIASNSERDVFSESSIRGSPDHTAVDKSNCDQTGSPCAESGKMNRESYEGSGNLGQRDICPAVSGCQNWSQRSVSASRCSTIDEEPDPDC
ncbi:Latrophilin-2 [Zootermopsis nevadensis]|uniref:Latrophilin-2 n=1 Tax=Zootermopsis nevadensis TaxID=136037 RepID=A0A067RQ65_ZOONE|nr:Latrophilin-2 [Zootermopsis nevadensis]